MSLIRTINRAGRRLFIHFHDDAEFEKLHPRKGGKFTKKGTGGGGGGVVGGPSTGEKPTPAKGAVVVNPIAVVLKKHGYEKKKGTNTYTHHTGHEVEVHAASEGQKWLTGWTHGTTGNTGSGAGKLDKHLQSLPHGTMATPEPKQEKMPWEEPPKPEPKPKAAKPHPLPKIHNKLSDMGFTPSEQDGYETTYLHNTKGKVVINNKLAKSGVNKSQAKWSYYVNPFDSKPNETGYGISNGTLADAIDKHSQTPTPTTPPPVAKTHVVKPSWAKYQNEEPTTWAGVEGKGDPESATRYYTGYENDPTESLVIGTGPNTKGQWQIWTKADGLWAKGEGQEELNAAFEGLHPRGAGGKFIAKPGSGVATVVEHQSDFGAFNFATNYGSDYQEATSTHFSNDLYLVKSKETDTWEIIDNDGVSVHKGNGQIELDNISKKLGLPIVGSSVQPQSTGPLSVPAHLVMGTPKSVGNYYFPSGNGEKSVKYELADDYTLMVGQTTGTWEVYGPSGNTTAEGQGQESLNKHLGFGQQFIGIPKPSSVTQNDHVKLLGAGYKPLGTAPWGQGVEVYGKEDGSLVLTKPLPNDSKASIFPIHQTALENHEDELTQMLDGKTPKIGEVPGGEGQSPQVQAFNKIETTNAITGLFNPFKAKGFDINPDSDTGGIVGILQNDPSLNMAFSYNPQTKKGLVSYQLKGDTGNAVSQVFEGTPGEFYNKVVAQHVAGMAAAGPAPITAQHFAKGDSIPAELNGIPFKEYVPPYDWHSVEGQNEHIQEPPMPVHPGKKPSAGLLIEEPDGRVWIVKPKNEYQGVKYTFPKGGQEEGDSLQATAIKEGWEESGLKAEITGYAGDYLGQTSITRYYYAKRTGGTPIGFGDDESELVSLVPKEELHKYLNQARDLQITKDHFTPKAIGRSIHFNSMTKIADKKGTNPGGIYQSPSGKKYYIKMLKSNQHAANELLAADLMAKAGGGTLKYHQIIADGGDMYVGTEWEELQKDNVSKLSLNEKKMAQSDFAINAWLANWDAAGTGGDNTGVLNGKTVTLDVGGALLYRAQGEPKGDAFGHVPNEWQTMRSDPKNPDAVKLYGDMTDQQLKESAEKLQKISNQDIKDAVDNHFDPGSLVADEIIDRLISRRDKIIQWGALIPAAATPTVAPTSSAQTTAAQAKNQPTAPTPAASDVFTKKHQENNPDFTTEYRPLLKHAPIPTKKEGSAVYQYTGGDFDPWNAQLRGSLGYDTSGFPTNDLMKYLAKASFPEDRVVKRRVSENFAKYLMAEAAEDNHSFVDPGFSSSDKWHGTLTLYINIPKGAQAAAVGCYSANHRENEILIQAHSKFIITHYDPSTKTMKVDLVRSGPSEEFAKQTGRPVGIWHKKQKGYGQ